MVKPESLHCQGEWDTLPKTNIAPENGWLEDEMSSWDGLFVGGYVSFREGISTVSTVRVLTEPKHDRNLKLKTSQCYRVYGKKSCMTCMRSGLSRLSSRKSE